MKVKIAILVCILECAGIVNCFSENIPLGYHARRVEEERPMVVPVTPPTAQLETLLTIDLKQVEEVATITLVNIRGEKVFEETYYNIRFVHIDPSLLEKGVYQMTVELKDSAWEGEFYVD